MYLNKRIAVVDILGGFANQVFQIAFANTLKNNGFEVYINLFNFLRVKNEKNSIITNRELILPIDFFNMEEITYAKFIKYDLIDKLNLSKFIFNRRNKIGNKYFSWFNDKNYNLDTVSKYNRYTGYWQTIETLNQNKKFILDSFKRDSLFSEGINNQPTVGSTSLHIRRSDYINMKEELSLDYYKNALTYASQNIENFHYEIFTDDEKWVREQTIFQSATKLHPFKNTKENTKKSFISMLKNENFIIANSSYSLLASFVKENSNSTILYPDPWFKNLNYQKLNRDNWIPIVNN